MTRDRAAWAIALLPPFAVGAVLRLWALGSQILGGDELHAVRAALGRPLGDILASYEAPDISVPLAALGRLVLAAGGTLDEGWLRLPGLAAGLAGLWLIPRLAARQLGRPAAAALAWLAALSPGLVLYSRIARAYMPLVLLTFAAAMACHRWLEEARPSRAAAYAGLASLAVLCHPVALPMALAPLAFAAGSALRVRPAEGGAIAGLRRLLPLAAALALALGAALLPAWPSLERLASTRRQPLSAYGWPTVRGLALLEAGASEPLAALGFWALAAWGLARLGRTHAAFAAYTAWLVAAQIGGVLLLAPVGANLPLLANRYTLVALPFVLIWVASGLDGLRRLAAGRLGTWGGLAVAALGVAAWTASGPLAERPLRTTSFAHHNDFVDFSCPRPALPPAGPPESYRRLAARTEPGAVVEVPWPSTWRFARSLPLYQEVHGRPVLVATGEGALWDPRLDLRAVVPARPRGFLASGARFVVVHLDLAAEERRLAIAPACRIPERDLDRPAAARLAGEGRRLAAALERLWGAPDLADPEVRVWDLDRVRKAAAKRRGSPAAAAPQRDRAAGAPRTKAM